MVSSRKEAVVVGGSNGIGLAITRGLIERGFLVYILDCVKPEDEMLSPEDYRFEYCNLLYLSDEQLEKLSKNENIELLMITAGIGRVADFQYFNAAEIDRTLTIDTVSTLKIFRIFYDRILSPNSFFCGVMGSIAGMLCSPMAAVYSAAKSGVCRFVEAVNIELEVAGTTNRILNISPGSIKGTKFYGGDNNVELVSELAGDILNHIFSRDTLFIPQYDEIYKNVLERYSKDPHEYGLNSYIYKKKSGRNNNESRGRIGYLSGTFDLFHIGHLNLLRRAKEQCDFLIVGVHYGGAWKGKETFIPLEERKKIVAACRYVDKVVDAPDEDDDAWKQYHYNMLFVGSDYKGTERFNRYEEEFKNIGVRITYFPYTKGTSSTQIRKAVSLMTSNTSDKSSVTVEQ